MSQALRFCAVGDISFEGHAAEEPSADLFSGISATFRDSDLVIANLECPLTPTGDGIPGKCTLRGAVGWAQVMRSAGIHVVTLANNHVMDYGRDGLVSTIQALRDAGIRHVGAGLNRAEACAPLLLDIGGMRVGLLGRSSVIVSAPTYATDSEAGVAFLEEAETLEAVRQLRDRCEIVVLILHWGLEEYSYPTPSQRELARKIAAAGAHVVIGHHPHVLQGVERVDDSLVIYSLGNFVFDEFHWSYLADDGRSVPQFSKLSEENRNGAIACIDWRRGAAAEAKLTYSRILENGHVTLDSRAMRSRDMAALSNRLQMGRAYAPWWRLYSLGREWRLRLGERMSLLHVLRRLHKIRPRHVWELATSLRRSARIVSERSSNPYE